MRVRRASLLLLLIFCGLLLAYPLMADDTRVYEFTNLNITAEVLPDGAMLVSEERTVNFQKGKFSGLYQWIKLDQGIAIEDIVVEENGRAYQFNPGSTYGPAGTYFLKRETDRLYVDWSFEAYGPETRTFVLKYKVLNAVKAYSDVAELYYQFVGAEWEKPVQKILVTLRLPAGAQKEEIRAWGHGPLHGDVRIENAEQVTWQIAPLPGRTFLEGRVAFPPQLVPEIKTVRQGQERLPQILEEETAWAKKANRERLGGILGVIFAVLLFCGVVVFAIYLHWRYGREFQPDFTGEYYRDLPVSFPPALAGNLWRFGKVETADLMATILDLARRGLIKIEEYDTDEGLIFKKKGKGYTLIKNEPNYQKEKGNLKAYEELVMNFLFMQVCSTVDRVSFAEIEAYTKRNPEYFYHQFWEKWEALVKKEADQLGFFDEEASLANWKMTGLGLGVLFLVMLLAIKIKSTVLLVSSVASFMVLIISAIFVRRRSRKTVEDYARLKAFRRFLADFSNMDKREIPGLILWEHFLVYAVPLGMADKVMEQLQLVFPNLEEDNYRFGQHWYYYGAGSHSGLHSGGLTSGISGLLSGFDSFSGEIENAIKTVQNASSGQGHGGGFSGGGGGGAGGGGGGVR